MKRVKTIAEGRNFTAVDVGPTDEVQMYSLIHAKTGQEVRGKVFLKEPTGATGSEISFTSIPPHSELGYFHRHTKDEETYIILEGSGCCQVDDAVFPIRQGSVIRVAPEGVRSLCNTSDEEMIYLCMQSKAHSLEEHTSSDGTRVACDPAWKER